MNPRTLTKWALLWLVAATPTFACGPGGASGGPSPEYLATIASIRNAIQGNPDAPTIAGMQLLMNNLSNQERVYVEFMSWESLTKDSVGQDIVLRKCLELLAPPSTDGGLSAPARLRLQDVPPGQVSATNAPVTGDLYKDARAVMRETYGEAKCHGIGCVSATLQGHLKTYGDFGTPMPPPGYADKGHWMCTMSFFDPPSASPGEDCVYTGFCRNEELIIENKTARTVCHDPVTPPPDAGTDASDGALPDSSPPTGDECQALKNTATGNPDCQGGVCKPIAKLAVGDQAQMYEGLCGTPGMVGDTCFEFGCGEGLRCVVPPDSNTVARCEKIGSFVGTCEEILATGDVCPDSDCYCDWACKADPNTGIPHCT